MNLEAALRTEYAQGVGAGMAIALNLALGFEVKSGGEPYPGGDHSTAFEEWAEAALANLRASGIEERRAEA